MMAKIQIKRTLLLPALLAAVTLVACSDGDSGTIEVPKGPDMSVVATEDLPNCTEKREGETALVAEDNATYKCENGKWKIESAPIPTVKTLEDLTNCSSAIEGDSVIVEAEKGVFQCRDGEWKKFRAFTDTLASADDLLACVAKREGNASYITEEHALYRCEDGSWRKTITFMDTVKAKDDLPNCTGKKEDDSTYVSKENAVYLCIDKSWRYLGDVAETSDNLPNCVAKREGEKSFIANEQVTLICSDGKWLSYDIYAEIKPEKSLESSSSSQGGSKWEDYDPESSGGKGAPSDSKNSSSSGKSSSSSVGLSSSSPEIDWSEMTCENVPYTTQTAGPDRGWGDFGYVIPLKVSTSKTQELYLAFATAETEINGPSDWETFGVLIAQYDASRKQWIPGTEIFSKDLKSADNCGSEGYRPSVNTCGLFELFTFDIGGTWLEEYAGKTVNVVVNFYAPGVHDNSSGMGLDYYSIPTSTYVLTPRLYFSMTVLDCISSSCKTETEDECEYGTLTDDRDGQIYKTVAIGTQTWMAENLNYETANSFCYNDSALYCEKYGRLYTWEAAHRVCPKGWHLPSRAEWEALFIGRGTLAAGGMLKSMSNWYNDGNGTDDFGFSALPAGAKDYLNNNYAGEGSYAYFWSSTRYTNGSPSASLYYYMSLRYYSDGAFLHVRDEKSRYAVRCLQD